jgi:acetolactate decarboxylase
MNSSCCRSAVVTVLLLLIGCSAPRDTVTQFSTVDALMVGAFDGHTPCSELMKHGDLGIGTFDRLDGEMVLLDGQLYQVHADGTVTSPASSLTTPFAAVVRFKTDTTAAVAANSDFAGFTRLIDEAAPNRNIFCAIRMRGTFSTMTTRSVAAQQRPYVGLAEAAKAQSVFHYENITGTIVGFRCPDYVSGINVPGYHLHFISDDRTAGGHVLNFISTGAVAELDQCHRFILVLPRHESFGGLDLSEDRRSELEEAER